MLPTDLESAIQQFNLLRTNKKTQNLWRSCSEQNRSCWAR